MKKDTIKLGQQVYLIGERNIASVFRLCSLCLGHRTIIDRAGNEVQCPVCDGEGRKEVKSVAEYAALPTRITAKVKPYYYKKSSAYRCRCEYWIEMPIGSCSVGSRSAWYCREYFFLSKELADQYAEKRSKQSNESVASGCVIESYHEECLRNKLYYLLSSSHMQDRKEGMEE